MTRKQDYLNLCNEQGHPLQDFTANVCIRCANLECHRSLASRASKFEDRVQNWHERLFENPPQMPETDPRFAQISAQKFVTIPTGRVPEVGAAPAQDWIDPNAPEPKVVIPPQKVVAPRQTPRLDPAPGTNLDRANELAAQQVREQADAEVMRELQAPTVQQPVNTPLRTGIMLDGATSPAPAPSDPWAAPAKPDHAPAPETDSVRKVAPGAKIRFGGGGDSGSGV